MKTVRGGLHFVLSGLVFVVLGCIRPDSASDPRNGRTISVFAAASLREVFGEIAKSFRLAHPGVELTFNYAGSQELRAQIEHGARPDVFASADRRHMLELMRAQRIHESAVFAQNELVVVVAKESVDLMHSFADLPRVENVVIGSRETPIGAYTLEVLDRASVLYGADFRRRVEAKVVSRELNVRQVLAKVMLGEARAGIVYRTDVPPDAPQHPVTQAEADLRPRRAIEVLDIPPEISVFADYFIGIVVDAPNPDLAKAWVDFVLSDAGQRVAIATGFLSPSRNAGVR